MNLSWPAAGGVTLQPGRQEAREWAIRELSGREYQEARPSLITRALTWMGDHISGWQGPGGPGAGTGAVIAVTVVALIVSLAVWRSGGLHRTARSHSGPALDGAPASSAQHYAAADQAASARDWNTAVAERFRGIARALEERTILSAQRGRTADEIAIAAAAVLPALGAEFTSAARIFDDVWYGGQGATAVQDDALRQLADRVRTVRAADLPVPAGAL